MVTVMNSFTAYDYVVFFGTLVFSMGIGVYFAVTGRKKKTEGEYLMANRSMSVIPVAVSITVSFLSAISILGNPAEMYNQGATFMLNSFGVAGGALLSSLVFVPLIYPLKLTSTFEYLERRFHSRAARLVGTGTTILSQVIYMGTASFAPATALQVVTGFPVWATLVIMVAVSTFYTSIGGMKAVIWTDVFQCVVMIVGVLAIIFQASIKVGSFSKVWDINDEWGRLDVWNFNPDPTIRHTFWAMTIGSSLSWMNTFGLSQAAVQRYSSLPTLKKAQMASFLIMFGSNFIVLACSIAGVAMFAYYVTKDCDPLGKRLVDNSNQLVPFFVMETLAYPCVPGIFISALFSGALSSISSSLNALAAVTWEDLLKPLIGTKIQEGKRLIVIQASVVAYGCLALAISFIVKNLEGTVLQVTISLIGAVSGPNTGMFVLGAFFPWANAKGVIGGAIISLAFTIWIAVGAYVMGIPRDRFTYPNGTCSEYFTNGSMDAMTTTPFTTATTTHFLSTSTIGDVIGPASDEKTGLETLYSISYLWYSALGMVATVVLGLIISFITGANKIDDVPTELQIPLASRLLCCLPRSWQRVLNCNRDFDDPEDIVEKISPTEMVKSDVSDAKIANGDGKRDFDNPAFVPDSNSSKVVGLSPEKE